MSKNTAKRILSAFTAAVMLLSCVPFVSAESHTATVIKAAERPVEWTKYVTMFSQYANSIKKDMPYCVVTNESGIAEKDGITVDKGNNSYEKVDEAVEKWLKPVFDGMFKSNSSVAKSFIEVLLGDGALNFDTMTFSKGENRDKYVPLYGSDSVSLITPEDKDFSLTVSHNNDDGRLLGIQVMYGASEYAAGGTSTRSKVFSLSDGTIDPIIISGSGTSNKLDVKFTDFKYGISKVELYFNEDGSLSKYLSEVPYEFTASLYDLLQVLDAVYKNAGFTLSFVKMGVDLANTILKGLGKTEISAEKVLSEYRLKVNYTVRTVISSFNYKDRLFGDIDGDGSVTVADARSALRHAVQLEVIKDKSELIYGDVDFDGDIDVADARLILRMAVQLDPTFSEVPDGKEIKIVVTNRPQTENTEKPDSSDTADTPDDSGKTDGGDGSQEKPDYSELEKFPASVAQAVFDIINQTEGTADDLIEYIKQIVAAAKG